MFARTIPQFWLWNLCPPPMMNTRSSGWDLLLISVDALADSVAISLAPPYLLFAPLLSVWQDLSSVLFSAMQATAA